MNTKRMAMMVTIIVGFGYLLFGLPDIGWGSRVVSAGKEPDVTFEKDITRILQRSCQECHRRGGVAPMSLTSYDEARPWARSIKEKVVTRVMPPFMADGPEGYYINDIRLTEKEIAAISRWVDSGAKRGNPADHPKDIVWPQDTEWRTGTPDLILKPKTPHKVRNDGIDEYALYAVGPDFKEDTWIRGIEFQPGNRAAVHHAALYLLPDRLKADEDGRIPGQWTNIMGGQLVLSWVPGSNPRVFKEGTAMMIPKGSRLGIQVHYAPTTKEGVTDHTSIGLFYANGVVNKLVRYLYGGRHDIDIPAGEKHYELVNYRRFRTDALITGFGAHMHLRGKSFKIGLIYPDGRKELLFDLPRFDFNWQRGYSLAHPITVPKGTVAEFTAVWDNSPQNPRNPDPTQPVKFGEKTTDEMMGSTIGYLIPDENLGIRVKNGVRIDGNEEAKKDLPQSRR